MPRILIVEDVSFMTAVYRSQLVKAGFDIDVAEDGKMALNKLEAYVPDLIILDLILPEKDGFYVLEHLRKNERTKEVPVLVVSSLYKDEDIKRALKLGADDYMVKSDMTLDGFADKINSMLIKNQ